MEIIILWTDTLGIFQGKLHFFFLNEMPYFFITLYDSFLRQIHWYMYYTRDIQDQFKSQIHSKVKCMPFHYNKCFVLGLDDTDEFGVLNDPLLFLIALRWNIFKRCNNSSNHIIMSCWEYTMSLTYFLQKVIQGRKVEWRYDRGAMLQVLCFRSIDYYYRELFFI